MPRSSSPALRKRLAQGQQDLFVFQFLSLDPSKNVHCLLAFSLDQKGVCQKEPHRRVLLASAETSNQVFHLRPLSHGQANFSEGTHRTGLSRVELEVALELFGRFPVFNPKLW